MKNLITRILLVVLMLSFFVGHAMTGMQYLRNCKIVAQSLLIQQEVVHHQLTPKEGAKEMIERNTPSIMLAVGNCVGYTVGVMDGYTLASWSVKKRDCYEKAYESLAKLKNDPSAANLSLLMIIGGALDILHKKPKYLKYTANIVVLSSTLHYEPLPKKCAILN